MASNGCVMDELFRRVMIDKYYNFNPLSRLSLGRSFELLCGFNEGIDDIVRVEYFGRSMKIFVLLNNDNVLL